MKPRGRKNLKRKPASRVAVQYFHIFSEGENTERDYFKALASTLDSSKVKIKYYGPIGVPKTVATKAIAFAKDNGLAKGRRKKKPDSYEELDQVWAVFDRDEFPCYHDAKQMCAGAPIPFAYSDPCFELWINLHFDSHDAPCDRHQAQAVTKKLVDGYDPKTGKTGDFFAIIGELENAEERAVSQRQARIAEDNANGNPSTNMYELTRAILEACKPKGTKKDG